MRASGVSSDPPIAPCTWMARSRTSHMFGINTLISRLPGAPRPCRRVLFHARPPMWRRCDIDAQSATKFCTMPFRRERCRARRGVGALAHHLEGALGGRRSACNGGGGPAEPRWAMRNPRPTQTRTFPRARGILDGLGVAAAAAAITAPGDEFCPRSIGTMTASRASGSRRASP